MCRNAVGGMCAALELAALLYGVGNECSAQGNTRGSVARLPDMKMDTK